MRLITLIFYTAILFQCKGQSQSCPIPAGALRAGDECGWLEVPELADQPNGATIRLAYVVVKSQSEHPKKDPVVFLQGGPGGGVLPLFQAYRNLRPHTDRDFILFDPRGTGYSGALCPEFSEQIMGLLAKDLDQSQELRELEKLIDQCKTSLDEQGINPAGYTTMQNVEDLEALRKHLGYDQWNIMGGSYGTRLGLAYQQLYPQSIRSTILIGLFPPEIRMYEGLVSNMDASLNWLFETCKNDNQCLQAYPNLEQTFERVLKRLAREPFEYNWRGNSFYLNDQDFLLFVHQSLYERNGLSNLPSLISAVDRGDAATISRFTDQLVLRLRIINLITYWSVMSCDEANYNNKQLMARDLRRNKQYQAGISLLTTDPEVLDIWSGYMNCQQELTVNDTNIPTLLVSGAFDPVTPPGNAKPLEKRMKAGQFVVFDNEGHAPFNSCLFKLMRDFLDQPSAPLQSACSQEEPPWSWR